MEAKQFTRIRSTFKGNEDQALKSVCKKENLIASMLVADHTEKQFRWNLIENPDYPFGLCAIEKTGEEEEMRDALHRASEHFDTTDGNIKRVEEKEDEQYFVFTRIR